MNVLVRSRVGRRFIGLFLLLSLPVIAAGWFGIHRATQAIRQQTHRVLRAASDGAEAQLREFLLCVRRTTEAVGRDERICAILQQTNTGPPGLNGVLERLKEGLPEAQEIFCISIDGWVIASSGEEIAAKDESAAAYFEGGRRAFYSGDLVRDAASGRVRWKMSAPVKAPGSERVLGVVVVGIDPAALSMLTSGKRVLAEGADTQSFRIGQTGETYIVNRNGFLLTESRFAPDAILRVRVETAPVRAGVERGQEMIGDYRDYRGVPVSGASAVLPEMGWVLVTEIDFSQAFAPIAEIRNALVWVAVGVGLVTSLMAIRFARAIVNPLGMASEADRALARGDEEGAMVPEEGLPGNEIGEFVRKRNVRIKELMERQRELVKEQKGRAEAAAELERLSYSMVHDMRAPLRAIITFGDLMGSEGEDRLSEAQRDYLTRMRTASVRMDQLICDMLKYSSLLRAEVPLTKINLSELLRQLVARNPKFKAAERHIEVPPAAMPPVRGNGPVLEQCFAALLDNALRYGKPGMAPEIQVRAEQLEQWVRISVEDNGTGMPKEFQRRVFGIFQKGTNSTDGTGIGLALVRVAVERMGGRVGVISEEGKGSRFWIELKAAR
jgi:signal transduction histidine kinase